MLDEGSESEERDEARILTNDEIQVKLTAAQELYKMLAESHVTDKQDVEKTLFVSLSLV